MCVWGGGCVWGWEWLVSGGCKLGLLHSFCQYKWTHEREIVIVLGRFCLLSVKNQWRGT